MKQKSVGAVVFRINGSRVEYLLLKYVKGHWGFVKGHIEKGESEEDTLLREAKEETGLNLKGIIKGFKEKINYSYEYQEEIFSKDVIYYLVKSGGEEVLVSKEHISYDWLPYEEAIEKLSFDNTKEILKRANSFIKSNF